MTDLGALGRRLGGSIAAIGVLLLVPAVPAEAFPSMLSPDGQLDFSYGGTVETAGGPATGYKPESKLFYTGDGTAEPVRWWAVLGTSGPSPAPGVWLFELVDHAWTPRLQLPQADPWAKTDTLFDGGTLYVSTRDDASSVSGNPRQSSLYEIPYAGSGSWGSVAGPFAITTKSIETLTIAKDSAGRIWTTFEVGKKISVGSTAPSGTAFSFLTISQTNVAADDVAAVTAFGGDRIGVFWSDQVAKRDWFAWHPDASAPGSGWTIETAYGGGVGGCPTASSSLCADDHLNLKVAGNQVYVAIKTSLNNGSGISASDPLIALLRRDPSGTWSSFPVSTVGQGATRPIALLDPAEDRVRVWASRNGDIDVWESSLSAPSFTSSAFQAWATPGSQDDPTSTKQVVTPVSGAVVESSVASADRAYHNEFLPSSAPPPAPTVTGFSPTSGWPGVSVTITGTGFTGASAVQFGGTSVGSGAYSVDSDTQITAIAPSGASDGPISVTTTGGTGSSSSNFSFISEPAPTVTSFTPTSGPPGTSVTITGSAFTGTTGVSFGGTPASTFAVTSDTQLSATVPSGASTGQITVTNGTGPGTSADPFTLTSPPAIAEVQKKHAAANDVTISATLPAPPTAGDVLVAVVMVGQAASPSFDTPPGWTSAFTPARGAMFWKLSDGTEQTVSVNLSAGQTAKVLRMWVVELSGVATTNPVDQTGSAIFTTQVTSVTPTTAGTTAQANEWAIAMVSMNGDNGGSPAATDGFTIYNTADSRDAAASKILSSTGTVSTTISWATARTGSWVIATLRSA